MIIGYDFLGDAKSISDTRIHFEYIDEVRVKNALYDEVMFKNGYEEFNRQRDDWLYSTVLLAKFRGNLEAGNIGLGDKPVGYIEIRKRKIEELNNWELVGRVSYESGKRFYFYDDLTESGQYYEYALIPITKNELGQDVEGEPVKKAIFSDFEDIFILNKDNKLKIAYDVELSNMERVRKIHAVETLGSRFPIISSTASLNYTRGQIRAKLISDRNKDRINNGENFDKRAEMKFREQSIDFLSDKSDKILKLPDGKMYLINISDNISWDMPNDWGRNVINFAMEWMEVDEVTGENLLKHGLIKGAELK